MDLIFFKRKISESNLGSTSPIYILDGCFISFSDSIRAICLEFLGLHTLCGHKGLPPPLLDFYSIYGEELEHSKVAITLDWH